MSILFMGALLLTFLVIAIITIVQKAEGEDFAKKWWFLPMGLLVMSFLFGMWCHAIPLLGW